jgi:ketosteroid isomerase-like protein
MRSRARWYGVSLLFMVTACPPATVQEAAAPVVDSVAVLAGVSELWQRWTAADIASDTTTLFDVTTDSVRVDYRGFAPILGRDAWRAFVVTALKQVDITAAEIHPELTVPISNDLSYQVGGYNETVIMGKVTTPIQGRFAAALRRGADSRWRAAYLMVFADTTITPQ